MPKTVAFLVHKLAFHLVAQFLKLFLGHAFFLHLFHFGVHRFLHRKGIHSGVADGISQSEAGPFPFESTTLPV